MRDRRRPALLVVAALIATFALTGCGGGPENVTLFGTVVDPPFAVAAAPLRTTEGAPFSLAKDTDAPLNLIFFGYTHCADICPAVLSSVASGLAKLTTAQQKQVQLYFVTSDPKRDTSPVLTAYVARFDPRFKALSGDLATIAKVAKSIGVFVDPGNPLASGGYDPNSHGSYVIGINANHQAPIFWNAETAPSQFAADFRFLLTQKPTHLVGPNG